MLQILEYKGLKTPGSSIPMFMLGRESREVSVVAAERQDHEVARVGNRYFRPGLKARHTNWRGSR